MKLFSSILYSLFICIEVLAIFNLLIIVHELGHFLAARWRGLRVEGFGIWFGKPIWKKKINGVTYSLGSIPAGGFVKLPQMAPMEALEGETEIPLEELTPISSTDKIIVAFAGPLFSFMLAVAFAVVVWQIGRPVSEAEATTTIGFVLPGSPAEKVGLQAGDKILEVDGQPVTRFGGMSDSSVTWRIIRSEGETIPMKVQRDGKELTFVQRGSETLHLPFKPQGGVIDLVSKGSPAAAAGLQPKDRIVGVDGTPMRTSDEISAYIRSHSGQTLKLTVERAGKQMEVSVTPVTPEGEDVPRIGIVWSDIGDGIILDSMGKFHVVHPSPLEQIRDSVMSIVNTVEAISARKSGVGVQHLGGPLMMMRIYYMMFESEQGWRMALWFSVVLNVNLALMNLIPIPVLDGGHILLATVEGISRRKVNYKFVEFINTAAAMLVIGFILFVSFFDAQDYWPWGKSGPSSKFTPKAATEQKK